MIQLQEFLSRFGSPLVIGLPEQEVLGIDINLKKNISLENLLEINKEYPVGLFFTPNGNFGINNEQGKSIGYKKEKMGKDPINAICFDLDIKDSNFTKEQLLKEVNNTILKFQIPPSYIIETPGGFHIYYMVDKKVNETIDHLVFFDIVNFIGNKFPCLDKNRRGLSSFSSLLRLPFSNHRKTGKPEQVKIIYVNNEVLLGMDNLNTCMKYIEDNKKIQKIKDFYSKEYSTKITEEINNIDFPDMLQKLQHKFIGGNQVRYLCDKNNSLYIEYKDGTTKKTDGYKYNSAEKYVNCFSDNYHDITERPRGNIYSYLYYWFNQNHNQVQKFLSHFYGISFSALIDEQDEIEGLLIKKDGYMLRFTNKRIQLLIEVFNKKGKVLIEKDIFKKPMKIIGRARTKLTDSFTEGEENQIVYLIEVDGEQRLMFRYPSKHKFNQAIGGVIFFYGDDNNLGLFYEAMECTEVEELDIVMLNGYHGDSVILGGSLYYGEETNKVIKTFFPFGTIQGTGMNVKSYYAGIKKFFKEPIATLSFLQAIVLGGMNIRDTGTIYPGLFLSGVTGSGKSQLKDIYKQMLGYEKNSRGYDISQLTPQPLKQIATDNSILYLDELTENVSEKSEELLRNVLNHGLGARGNSGSNTYYNFRSPIFLCGERQLKDESLNNRFVLIMMSQEYRTGERGLSGYFVGSCANEIYATYIKNKHKVNPLRKNYKDFLQKYVEPRQADVYAYMFVVNEVFEIGMNKEELLDIVQSNIKKTTIKRVGGITPEKQLQLFLIKQIINKNIIVRSGEENEYFFTFIKGDFNKHIGIINECSQGYPDNIFIEYGEIMIKYNEINATEKDKSIYLFLTPVIDVASKTRSLF